MALVQRMKNLMAYSRPSRLKAAFGLLSSDERREWILSVKFPRLNTVTSEKIYPWYTFQSIKYIEKLIRPDMKVLEYGSGYSTLWWANRVAKVISIERSKDWCLLLKEALLKHNYQNVELIHFAKIPGNIDSSTESRSLEDLDSAVSEYIISANPAPESFDVVVVDDVYRNIVSKHAIKFLKPGGMLILDDSQRPSYGLTTEMFDQLKWNFAHFYGATPYHFADKQTTIWFKPTVR